MNINNLKELEQKRTLEIGDKVYFTIRGEIVKCTVYRQYLNVEAGCNDKIFDILNINKEELAEKAYGYPLPIKDGYWPFSNKDDYPALTRLVKELYKIIEEKYPTEVYTPIYSRFEILDL